MWSPGGGWFYGRNACNSKALAQNNADINTEDGGGGEELKKKKEKGKEKKKKKKIFLKN